MTLTLPNTVPPDAPIKVNNKPNRLAAQFGDGYSQRASAGLNSKPKMVELKWSTLITAEFDELKDFFEDHEDGTSFYYTLPTEGSARKWIVEDWDDEFVTAASKSLYARLKEVFDI